MIHYFLRGLPTVLIALACLLAYGELPKRGWLRVFAAACIIGIALGFHRSYAIDEYLRGGP